MSRAMRCSVVLIASVIGCGGPGAMTTGDDAGPDDAGPVDAPADASSGGDAAVLGVPMTQTYVKASNARPGSGRFGIVALSLDGSTLAVGAKQEPSAATGINGDQTDTSALFTGAVYVYARAGSTWTQQAYIKGSNTRAGDHFGENVSLSADGNTLAVAAIFEDSSAGASGAVYVFGRTGDTWTEQAFIKASNADPMDIFGKSLALSADGQTMIVGAYFEDSAATTINGDLQDDSAPEAGAAYVFVRNGSAWTQQAYLKASNASAASFFGNAVSISEDGNIVAVAAYQEDSAAIGVGGNQLDTSAFASGAAYVFVRSANTWAQTAYIKASNTRASSHFGNALSLSPDGFTLAVASRNESSGAVGIGGDQTSQTAGNSGAVYVFHQVAAAWAQQAYIKASNAQGQDRFGECVALSGSGNRLIVGALYEDSGAIGINGDQQSQAQVDSGAAYVFERATSSWSQLAYVKAINTGAGDAFGSTSGVAVSGSGGLFAIGADSEDGGIPGVGGNANDETGAESGAVYLLQ